MRAIQKKAVDTMQRVLDEKFEGCISLGPNDKIIGKLDGDGVVHAQWIFYNTIIADVIPDDCIGQAGKVMVRNGGYFTRTTKNKINAVLEKFAPWCRVWQVNGVWYYKDILGSTVEFNEGFTV